MNYFQVNFFLGNKARSYDADLLKNDLLSVGFDSFVDIDGKSFEAYCPEKDFHQDGLQKVIDLSLISDKDSVKYEIKFIKDENWNRIWEETSPSVLFGDFCHIRKSTQPYKKVRYDIIINPEQSFGTANHPTTAMIIEYLSAIDMQGKNVMDMGCGTAVLGILCNKMGAEYVECVDIDQWAYRNAMDNAAANKVDITVKLGSSGEMTDGCLFDLFLANINLNILLDNIKYYAPKIKQGGLLVLSGFYEEDVKELQDAAQPYGLAFYDRKTKDEWALLVLKKI